MAKADKAVTDDKYKQVAADMMQQGMKLRNSEKQVEVQKERIENLEKIREIQLKTAAENADAVSRPISRSWPITATVP